jgi:hypothetical protein
MLDEPSNQLLLPVTQVKILSHFSAFVTVFQRFFWLMIQFAEWMFWIPNGFRDDFHHSFHNATLVVELYLALASWSQESTARTTPDYETGHGVGHSNFPTDFSLA